MASQTGAEDSKIAEGFWLAPGTGENVPVRSGG